MKRFILSLILAAISVAASAQNKPAPDQPASLAAQLADARKTIAEQAQQIDELRIRLEIAERAVLGDAAARQRAVDQQQLQAATDAAAKAHAAADSVNVKK